MPRPTLALAGVLLLGGCAQVNPEPLPASHPASPAAAEGQAALSSDTLAIAPTDPAGTNRGDGEAVAAHDHHGGAPSTNPAAGAYGCPHHPEVVSDKPGTCPKCKMTLEKKE